MLVGVAVLADEADLNFAELERGRHAIQKDLYKAHEAASLVRQGARSKDAGGPAGRGRRRFSPVTLRRCDWGRPG